MAINNFPAALQPIIQTGYLERAFEQSLRATLAYRSICDRENFPSRIGETITKTRAGLLAASTSALSPSGNTNFDNGLSPASWGVEQYTMSIAQYGNTLDLNIAANTVGIASQFVQNAKNLGEAAARSMDLLASAALFNAYMGGNTRIRTGATSASQAVDDVRGFQTVFVNGVPTPVGGGNNLAITVNGVAATVTAVSVDGSNVSTAPGGVSGVLTLSGSITSTTGQAVVASNAPVILRPNARATTAALTSGDTMAMIANVLQATTTLRMNAVPDVGGAYNCYLDPQQLQGLFNDAQFQLLFRGAYQANEYKQGAVIELLGIRFIPTTMAPQQTVGSNTVHRAVVCGKGVLIEGDAVEAMRAADAGNDLAEVSYVDGVKMITRAPMDRLQQIVAQSYAWIGGFAVPTDTTATASVLPTATSSAYKRAVIIESL